MKKGFTLIELLIVVAIIAILAAIAVPNFLEAQTRAKVSRVQSDMRTIATALETYHIDSNRYPLHGFYPDWGTDPNGPQVLHSQITTPVSYLNSLTPTTEPFTDKVQAGANFKDKWINSHMQYACFQLPWNGNPGTIAFAQDLYGKYRLVSAGPDGTYFKKALGVPVTTAQFAVITYDSTNGTISNGDIFRTSKEANPNYYRP